MAEEAQNKKQDRIYTIIGALVVAGLLVWWGMSASNNKNNLEEKTDSVAEESSQTIDESEQPSKSGNPESDIRRVIMVDTVSKWNDVDEFSLRIDENITKAYPGDLSVNITANYNGTSSSPEEVLVSYCNKIATAIDLTRHSVAELNIVWTIPFESDSPAGTCHYHSKDGVLIYDDESDGILTNR